MPEVDNPAFTLDKLLADGVTARATDVTANITAFGEAEGVRLAAGTPGASGPVPGASVAPTAVGGAGIATVTFVAPVTNTGPAIQAYVVTASSGGYTKTGTSSPLVVSGMTAATRSYTVKAINAAGAGAASPASNSVVTT